MLFKVYKTYSDTCGNSDRYLLGVCELASEEEAKNTFPQGFMVTYELEKFKISSVSEIKKRFEEHEE